MTEYVPVSGQDRNSSYYSNPHMVSPHYSNGNGINYFYPQGQIGYSAATTYPTYPSSYMPSPQQHPSQHMYMPSNSSLGMQYQLTPPTRPFSQSRTLSYPPNTGYHSGTLPTQRLTTSHHPRMTFSGDLDALQACIESQESPNEDISEPVLPPLEGYPSVESFDRMVRKYVEELSPKKRDKALITARRARNIRTVLLDKKTTSIESAQFRFWVKKMFSLRTIGTGSQKSICHETKPVAVREKLFKILTYAHKACQHGGRDKTSLQVRRVYSWVPKELISRFVKECPTCKIRRPSQRDVEMTGARCNEKDCAASEDEDEDHAGPPDSRRGSATTSKRGSISSPIPMGYSSTFAQQNRWMSDLPNVKTKNEHYDTMNYPSNNHLYVASPNYSRISQQMSSMSFSSPDSAMSGISAPSGFPSSSVRSTGSWPNSAYPSGYQVRQDRHGERYIKAERHI